MKRLNHYFETAGKMNRFTAFLFTAVLLAAFPFSKSFSNGLTISNITFMQNVSVGGTVTFDLTWNNSWRRSDWTAKNWDAAWVFVKWRSCSDPYSVLMTHGTVSTNLSDHTFSGTTALEPTDRYGNGSVIDASPDNTGLMLRRSADGIGAVSASVTMTVTNLPASGTTLDLRMFGIEMVFVPQNAYVLGDGDGANTSTNAFTSTAVPTTPNINSMEIINEAAQSVNEVTSYLCTATGLTGRCDLTAQFPKGYGAFYMMKYEISQGQFTDFINSINSSGQAIHYPNQNANRQTIIYNITQPTPYFAARPDRACNYLSWINVSAYLQWAALRPLTELEYEKAARGTEPAVPFQKAWGTTAGIVPLVGSISGVENGTETITTAGANVNSNGIAWTSGDANGVTGPLRNGIFATAGTTSRYQTGMGFHGAMELSGNVWEYYVSVASGVSILSGPSSGASGITLGNGTIDPSTGYHTNSTWPVANSPSSFIIRRGGSWNTTNGHTSAATIETNISYRGSTAPGGTTASADNTSGGRGGR